MEFAIFVGLVVLGLGVYMYNTRKNHESKIEPQAPYKVEPQSQELGLNSVVDNGDKKVVEPTKCGCGRSPTGFCVGLHKLTIEEWAVHSDNPNKVETAVPVKKPRKTASTKTTATKNAAASKAKTKKAVTKKTVTKSPKATS